MIVSVLIPVFNASDYIESTIQSVLNQSMEDFELILVNDGSTDNSAELIKQFEDQRIRYYENDRNRGIAYTRNRLIELSKSKYLAVLDADDIALPNRLETQVRFLENHPDYALVGSSVEVIDENDQHLENWWHQENPEETLASLFFKNQFVQSSVMMNKPFLDKTGIYNTDLPPAEDYDLWLRLSNVGRVYNLPQILVKYRVHRKSVSRSRPELMKRQLFKIISKSLSKMGIAQEKVDLHAGLSSQVYVSENTRFKDFSEYFQLLAERNSLVKLYDWDAMNSAIEKSWIDVYEYKFEDWLKFLPDYWNKLDGSSREKLKRVLKMLFK